eukprot:sb/3471547/
MVGTYSLLFLLGAILTGQAIFKQVEIVSATARTVYESNHKPKNAIDGDTTTHYISDGSQPAQWLKLELKEPTSVGNIVIINRLWNDDSQVRFRDRLLGTTVSLIGSTTNTTCGTINTVNIELSVEEQTYTIHCPVTREKTLAVFLYDDVMELSMDKGNNRTFMNIAEVVVYKMPISKYTVVL